jgi:hypothetical protein
MSALAEIIPDTPPMTDKAARAAWRAQMWRVGKKEKRENRLRMAALQGLISWRDLADIPDEGPPAPGPARACQWISDDGCYCNAPSVFGRSWCGVHCARVFVTEVGDG